MDWNGSVVKPPAFENEGALHIGKGRFLLSMSGDRGGKALSTRAKIILAILAAVVVVAALVVTSLLAGHQANSIPYRLTLRNLLGSGLRTISQELGVAETDWTQQGDGTFLLNDAVKVSGISYKLRLHFDSNAKLEAFEYTADYQANSSKAASDLYKAAVDLRIEGELSDTLEGVEPKTPSLRKYFKQNKPMDASVSSTSSHQSSDTDTVGQYLKEVEASPDWPGLLHGYIVQPARVYEDINVGYAPDTESVLIHIICQIEPQRGN